MDRIEPFKNRQEFNPTNLKRKRRSTFGRSLLDDPFFDHLGNDDLFKTFDNDNDFLNPGKMLKKILKDSNLGFTPFTQPFKYKYHHLNDIDDDNESNEIYSQDDESNENNDDIENNIGNSIYLKNFNDVSCIFSKNLYRILYIYIELKEIEYFFRHRMREKLLLVIQDNHSWSFLIQARKFHWKNTRKAKYIRYK